MLKSTSRRCLLLAVIVGGLLVPGFTMAQVPHVPGAICRTPEFWCWADPPGYPGTPCVCPSPTGPTSGVLG
ncbi:hypothetical protein SAMN05428969_1332 [Devosia sp. YR412]|uniref:hypothetical protein n=1 Tax=Devosia sp. YR412 TaxID=1881030 RepID=UPI0008CDCC35|nr:hypothetical protein [Devosia sp. YR412]SEP96794.1 hypothetical protein SAMN05428969_1332 [Devosia sp. YR412]